MTLDNGFLKNILDLEENPNKIDAFNLSEQYAYFDKKIKQTSNKSIMSIVGFYGSGKSTMLNNIQKNSEQKNTKWITFDAWSYPERKGLWDGLILKIALEILGDTYSTKAQKAIDGAEQKSKVATTISAITTITSVATVGFDIKNIIPEALLDKIGTNFDDFQKLSNSGPIIRIEGFKELFRKILNQIGDNEIIVILEDIDRAGKEGIFFLETLFQFLKFESSGDFNIKFIVPISKNSYLEDFESYMKCIDTFEFFNIKPNGVESYIQFTKSYFDESLFESFRKINPLYLLSEFFFLLSRTYEISFRKLGLMIRSANARYIYLKNIFPNELTNPYTVIVLECMSYVDKINGEKKTDHLSEFVKNRKLGAGDLFGAMLSISQYKNKNYSLIQNDKLTEIFSRDEIKIENQGGMIFDYYFKYLRELPPLAILYDPSRFNYTRSIDI